MPRSMIGIRFYSYEGIPHQKHIANEEMFNVSIADALLHVLCFGDAKRGIFVATNDL